MIIIPAKTVTYRHRDISANRLETFAVEAFSKLGHLQKL